MMTERTDPKTASEEDTTPTTETNHIKPLTEGLDTPIPDPDDPIIMKDDANTKNEQNVQ